MFPDGASPYGVMDLSGNILEWSLSPYADPYQAHTADQIDMEEIASRALRGGRGTTLKPMPACPPATTSSGALGASTSVGTPASGFGSSQAAGLTFAKNYRVTGMKDYHINIFYSQEDEAYIADIPDFEMCSAHGDTPQEALEQVLIARDAILAVMQAKGLPIPEPRYRPAIYQVSA